MENILEKMIACPTNVAVEDTLGKPKFLFEPIDQSHKADAARILANTLHTKSSLERLLTPANDLSYYYDQVYALWDFFVEKGFSFVVRSADSEKKLLGVTLNFDIYDGPMTYIKSSTSVIPTFLTAIHNPIKKEKLPKGKGKVLYCCFVSTNPDLNPAETVSVVAAMKNECISLARREGFEGVFTTNTSPLTQQLDIDVYGYEVLLDYQVNKYVAADGSKPFSLAPDDQRAICCWKKI